MEVTKYFDKKIKKIPSNIKRAFLYTLVVGVLTHMFFLTNKFINHDDLLQLVHDMDFSSSGRWFLKSGNAISSNLSMSWVNGCLVIIYTGIMAAILVDIFQLKSKLSIFFTSAMMITFPSNAALFPYSNSYDAYAFGGLLAFIGMYHFIKQEKISLITISLTVLGLASYQIYFAFCFATIVVYYLVKLLRKETNADKFVRNLLLTLINYLIAIISYVIITKYVLKIELTDYQNIDKMGSLNLLTLIKSIPNTYAKFYEFFIKDSYYQFSYLKYLNIIFFIACLYLIIDAISKLKNKEMVLASLTIFLLPIFINLIYLMAPNSAIGLRMLQTYIVFYVLSIVLVEYFANKNPAKIMAGWIICLSLFLSIFNFVVLANKVYTAYEIDKSNILSYTTRVLSKIESEDFYEADKKVYFIGNPDITNSFTPKYTSPDVLISTILDKKVVAHLYWKLYPIRYAAFPNEVDNMWYPDYSATNDELKQIIDEMPMYPAKGSIIEYDNEIYVKFRDYKTWANQ